MSVELSPSGQLGFHRERLRRRTCLVICPRAPPLPLTGIDHHALVNAGPLTQLVKVTLSVANNNHQPVAFKVKTTAPKSFCVRPNSGRIEPGERVEVQGGCRGAHLGMA